MNRSVGFPVLQNSYCMALVRLAAWVNCYSVRNSVSNFISAKGIGIGFIWNYSQEIPWSFVKYDLI